MGEITLGQIVSALALITAIASFGIGIAKPIGKFTERVADLERLRTKYDTEIELLRKDTGMLLKTMNVVLDHMSDNNHTGEIIQQSKELKNYIYTRKF